MGHDYFLWLGFNLVRKVGSLSGRILSLGDHHHCCINVCLLVLSVALGLGQVMDCFGGSLVRTHSLAPRSGLVLDDRLADENRGML